MSVRLAGSSPRAAKSSPWLSVTAALMVVALVSCATSSPRSRQAQGGHPKEVVVYEVDVLEPGAVATRPVPIEKADFQRAIQQLAREMRWKGTPWDAARELLHLLPQLEGDWLAEVSRGRVLTLVPVGEHGPLTPEAEDALRRHYLGWCEKRGGGDCLRRLDDGPYLLVDDRRALALALALGSVLEETREALGQELDPNALLATVLSAVGFYLGS